MKKRFIKSQSGFSLLNSLLTLGIVSGSLYTITHFQQITTKSEKRTVQISKIRVLNSNIATMVKQVFVNVNNESEERTEGLCKYISAKDTNVTLSHIYLKMPQYQSTLFENERWEKYLAGFKVLPLASCKSLFTSGSKFSPDDSYQICVESNPEEIGISDIFRSQLKSMLPKTLISVETIYTNPIASRPFSKFKIDSSKEYDVKAIGLKINVATSYLKEIPKENEEEKRITSLIEDFIWAGQVAACNLDGKTLDITAMGPAMPDKSIVLNVGGFTKDSLSTISTPPLSFQEIFTQIQSGKLLGESGASSITTDDTSIVFSSCNEISFRCRQDQNSDLERDYSEMRHQYKLSYNRPNSLLTNNESILFSPSFSFFKESPNAESSIEISNKSNADLKVQYFLDGKEYASSSPESKVNGKYKNIFSWIYHRIIKGEDGKQVEVVEESLTPLVAKSDHRFEVKVVDKDSLSDYQSISNQSCRSICTKENNYNTTDQGKFLTKISYEVFGNDFSPNASTNYSVIGSPVHCTSCYFKNCDRFGLGTFGSMTSQPTEPSDAGIPECVRHEEISSNFIQKEDVNLSINSANKCVAVQLNNDDNSGFTYSAFSCDDVKNILCFNFGKHFLMRELSESSSAIKTGTFAQSSDTCFESSKEVIDAEALEALFLQQKNNEDESVDKFFDDLNSGKRKGKFTLYNLSTQGSLFAPMGLNQEQSIRKYADEKNDKNILSSNFSWTHLKTDNLGYMYAPAPEVSKASLLSSNKWSLHYDGRSMLRPYMDEPLLELQEGDGVQIGLLYHHRRYKGVMFANIVNPIKNLSSDSSKDEDKDEDEDEGEDENEDIVSSPGLRFLCQQKDKPGTLFVTSKRSSKGSDGPTICLEENGLFLPPLTSAGWEVALQLVHPNSLNHSFPDLVIKSGVDYDPVFIGLEKSSEENHIYSGSIPTELLTGTYSQYISSTGSYVPETSILSLCYTKATGQFEKVSGYCQYSTQAIFSNTELSLVKLPQNRVVKMALIFALRGGDLDTTKTYQIGIAEAL